MGNKMQVQYLVLLCIAGAALSWGLYVPMVHNATLALKSNLRAFLFVGIAYFITAVLIPVLFVFVLKWDPTISKENLGKENFDFWACLMGTRRGHVGCGRGTVYYRCRVDRRQSSDDVRAAARLCRCTDHQYDRGVVLLPSVQRSAEMAILSGLVNGGGRRFSGDVL
jgi:hypothetical protein